jgi:hypothetical protein
MHSHKGIDTSSLGNAVKLKNSVNLWELESNSEVELAMRVLNDLGIQI